MRTTRSLTALAAVSALALLGAGCSSDPSGGKDSGKAAASCPGGKIRFGIEPYEDPAKLTPAYEVLAKALESKLDCPVELKVVEDYSAEVLAMRNGQLEIAQFGPLGYVFASEKANARALVSFADAKGALSTYTGGIWVPADSPVKSLKDLKGKSLALSSPGSTSGDALPRYALKTTNVDKVKINYAGGHPEALLALTKGKVDAAEINSQQLETAKAEGSFDPSEYRRIWTSSPIPNDPITVSDRLDPKFQDAVKKALLDLEPDAVAEVGAFLDINPPGPLVAVTKETYKPLFALASGLDLTEKDV
ncbi:phosphate/phosphite/phosphonate ABC transporter substrate-binding protein [Streptomyces koelreuteriae]|uniref:phosphate/phosphite/phosphonate ABC transporter substrate-binding protein n=1 Tax=Streptomyces koelreuteriae TaxID=2838015 RepID=UPI003EC0EC89